GRAGNENRSPLRRNQYAGRVERSSRPFASVRCNSEGLDPMPRLLLRALHKLVAPSSAAMRPDAPPSPRVGSDDATHSVPATQADANGKAQVLLPLKSADPPNRTAA